MTYTVHILGRGPALQEQQRIGGKRLTGKTYVTEIYPVLKVTYCIFQYRHALNGQMCQFGRNGINTCFSLCYLIINVTQ